jgi:hypothetical protein
MTCFWTGIIQSLKKNGIKNEKTNVKEFIEMLKQENKRTNANGVLWNGETITDKQMEENVARIDELNIETIGQGYDCSSCDAFLFLVSAVFKVHIEHMYMGHKILYMYTYDDLSEKNDNDDCVDSNVNGDDVIAIKTIKVKSNKGHFWCD